MPEICESKSRFVKFKTMLCYEIFSGKLLYINLSYLFFTCVKIKEKTSSERRQIARH